jgi:hypothetical protein
MVIRQPTLKQLRIAIVREKSKASTIEERRALERQLKLLRSGKGIKFLRRSGRGFVILTKKGARATGRGIVKARKFAEESGAAEGLDIQLVSSLPTKSRRRIRSVRRRSPVRVSVVRRVKTTTRRVKIRPRRRRRVVRRTRQSNGDFFGNFSDLGI